MANFDTIKTAIDANIKTNGTQDITGCKMNSILHQMVDATDEQLTELESNIGNFLYKDAVSKNKAYTKEIPITSKRKISVLINAEKPMMYAFYVRKMGQEYTRIATELITDRYYLFNEGEFDSIKIYIGENAAQDQNITIHLLIGEAAEIISSQFVKVVSPARLSTMDNVSYVFDDSGNLIRLRYVLNKEDIVSPIHIITGKGYEVAADYLDESNNVIRTTGYLTEVFVEPNNFETHKVRIIFRNNNEGITIESAESNSIISGEIVTYQILASKVSYKSLQSYIEKSISQQVSIDGLLPIKNDVIQSLVGVGALQLQGNTLVKRVQREWLIKRDSMFSLSIKTSSPVWVVVLTAYDVFGDKLYDSGWQTSIECTNRLIKDCVRIRLEFAYFEGDNTYMESVLASKIASFQLEFIPNNDNVDVYSYSNVADLKFAGNQIVKRVKRYFYIREGQPFSLAISTNGVVSLTAYDVLGNKLYDSGWQTSINNVGVIIPNAVRLLLEFAYFEGDYTYREADLNSMVTSFTFKAYRSESYDMTSYGSYYFGNRISLDIQSKATAQYIAENVIQEIYRGEDSIIPKRNQSIAIANNRIFAFADNNYIMIDGQPMSNNVKVYDLQTLSEIATANTGVENTHHNNAQFTEVYLQDNPYPLMLLSRGDYEETGSPYQEFYVVEVSESNNQFTFTKRKTITCNIDNVRYNGSWVYDSVREMLYMYTYTKGTWRVTEDNDMTIIAIPMAREELKSNNDITIEPSEISYQLVLPYCIMQGAYCHNGRLYMPVQNLRHINGYQNNLGTNVLIVVDVINGTIESALSLANQTLEPEGIAIYDKNIYISYHDGNASIGAICMTLERYNFL